MVGTSINGGVRWRVAELEFIRPPPKGWESLFFKVVSDDIELFHPVAEGAWVDAEQFRCAFWALNTPTGFLKNLRYVFFFDGSQSDFAG